MPVSSLIKIIAVIIIVVLSVSLLWLWVMIFFVGRYYNSAGIFQTVMVGLAPILLIVLTYIGIKQTLKIKIENL